MTPPSKSPLYTHISKHSNPLNLLSTYISSPTPYSPLTYRPRSAMFSRWKRARSPPAAGRRSVDEKAHAKGAAETTLPSPTSTSTRPVKKIVSTPRKVFVGLLLVVVLYVQLFGISWLPSRDDEYALSRGYLNAVVDKGFKASLGAQYDKRYEHHGKHDQHHHHHHDDDHDGKRKHKHHQIIPPHEAERIYLGVPNNQSASE